MTEWETGLIVAALLLFLATVAAPFVTWGRARRAYSWGTGLLAIATGLLAVYFLAGRLGVEYVFSYTKLDYPWYYRLAGLWAGQKGTLLMWATFLAGGGWVADRLVAGSAPAGLARAQDLRRHLRTVMAGLSAVFAAVLLVAKVFEATPDYLLQFRPIGNGLQPVLLTPFMVIHPPLQFVAYGLVGVVYAAGLVNVATGNTVWAAAVRPLVRVAWMISTIGLGLGGLWAYYVLNFGGFWAWDPVETANLIAWFPLTILLHTLIFYEKGRYRSLAPMAALLTLPAALFATVATRTGLWVSVHAFTDPSRNFARDPFQRLLFILETSPLLQVLTAVFFTSLLVVLVAVGLGRLRHAPIRLRRAGTRAWLAAGAIGLVLTLAQPVAAVSLLFEAAYAGGNLRDDTALAGLLVILGAVALWLVLGSKAAEAEPVRHSKAGPWARYVNARTIFAAGVLLLVLAFLVTFLLDMASVQGYSRQAYDDRAPWVALPLLAALGTYLILPWAGHQNAALTGLGAIGLGLAAMQYGPWDWAVGLVAPVLMLVAVGAGWRVLKTSRQPATSTSQGRRVGLLLLAGGLLGTVFWSNPPSYVPWTGNTVDLPWGWAVPGYLASYAALGAGVLVRARDDARIARWGAAAVLIGWGYGVGVALAVAVWRLARDSDRSRGFRAWVTGNALPLRRSFVFLLHVFLAIGLSGYAVATYQAQDSQTAVFFDDQAPGGDFAGYSFQVLSTHRHQPDPIDGSPQEFQVRIMVHGADGPVGPTTLVFWKVPDGTPWHYDAKTTVVRLPDRDLYLFPASLRFSDGELADHNEAVYPPGGDVEAVALAVKVIPGMPLVWTGLWSLTVSMFAILVLGGRCIQWPHEVRPPPQPGPVDGGGHGPA